MLTVTETAAAIIRNTLEANRQAEDDVFRVSHADNELTLTMGEEQDGDLVIQHQDRAILVLEQSVVDALGDVIIDTDASEGAQLIIKPGAESEQDQ